MKILKKIGVGFGWTEFWWTCMLLISLVFLLVGCQPQERNIGDGKIPVNSKYSGRWAQFNIDDCEYLRFGAYGFTHKGNCTNKIHIYNVEK